MNQELFLTSSPFYQPGKPLNSSNKFIEKLSLSLKHAKKALFIASDPDNYNFTEEFSFAIKETMKITEIVFDEYQVLDNRNDEHAKELVMNSDFIILAGGHVPTQNRFFQKMKLRELMKAYEGVILGISAGTMNSADIVYAQPELEGESTDSAYQRFLRGLNLTKCMIIPHYQDIKDQILDGKRLFEDITYPDSYGQKFYALPDGSYLYSKNGVEKICGEAYLIQDGNCVKVCSDGEELALNLDC